MLGNGALRVTLCLTVLVGLVFGVWPWLDLAASNVFANSSPSFAWRLSSFARQLRSLGMALPACVAATIIVVLLVRMARPRRRPLADTRSLTAVLLIFVLGPGLLVNGVLKSHWGRERPFAMTARIERGDMTSFQPWWDPRGPCRANCSFVSGEVSGAAVLIAAAAVLPSAVSGMAVAAALLFTIGVALLRVAFGGHFLSDVLFAALFTHLIAIVVMRIMHDERWPPGRAGAIEAWWPRHAFRVKAAGLAAPAVAVPRAGVRLRRHRRHDRRTARSTPAYAQSESGDTKLQQPSDSVVTS